MTPKPRYIRLAADVRVREADNWRASADCRTTDPELFFNYNKIPWVEAVCVGCPVKRDCLDDVMSMPDYHRNVGQYRAGQWFGRRS